MKKNMCESTALKSLQDMIEKRKKVREDVIKNDPLNVLRYDYEQGDGNWGFPGHVKRDDGKWVSYEEHLRVVEYLKQEIKKAYASGKADGGPEYSWRV